MKEYPNILLICTANHCRSPLIEFALRRRCIERGRAWSVGSAGTRAFGGQPPHPYVKRLLDAHGDDSSGWLSRALSDELIDGAELILTASLENRNEVVRSYPRAARRTFLFVSFAHFIAAQGTAPSLRPVDLHAFRAIVTKARTEISATQSGRDIQDPMGRSFRTFRRIDRQIEAGVKAIVGAP